MFSGEVGATEDEVLRLLMGHVSQHAGLQLTQAASPHAPREGEWVNMRCIDELAPAGRVRMYLRTLNDVDTVRQALHEQSISVGSDLITITVRSDLQDAAAASGNSGRGRASVGPAPVRR